MALPPKWYQFLIGVFVSLGSVLFGYDLGVIAEVIVCPSFLTTLGNPTTAETGAVVSVFTGGAFFGAMFAGPIGDWFGRKYTILIGALIFCVGGGLQTGATNINYLYAGRSLAGAGVGFLVMIIPLYQAEIAHPSIRGRITALQQLMLGIGALVASWTSYGTYTHYAGTDNKQWRIPLGIQIIPAGVLAALILLFPESPRWLIDHGREAEALRNLANLHAQGDENDTWVRAEYQQIVDAIAFEHAHEAKGYTELFTHAPSLRRLVICCALQASIQMTGVSAIQYYSVTIFNHIGIDDAHALKYQGINSVLALLGELSTVLFIDKTGRRWVLISGNIFNACTFIVATILLAKFPPGSIKNYAAGWGFILTTWLYNISFSFTCGPLSWIIPAEVFDTRTRSKGVSIATMTSFAFNTLIGQVTGIAMANIGWRYYILFIVGNLTNALFFWCFLPETARRPLEEMNYLFTNAPLFVPGMKLREFETHDLERRVSQIEDTKEPVEVVEDKSRQY